MSGETDGCSEADGPRESRNGPILRTSLALLAA
jgi:hypothetical protein